MTQLETLCHTLGITARAKLIGPAVDADGWHHDLWAVTLRFQGRSYTAKFRTGTGHRGRPAPSAADVLSALISDAQAGAVDFETWCSEFGVDPDSRKAEATWKACRRTIKPVKRLCGTHLADLSSAEH